MDKCDKCGVIDSVDTPLYMNGEQKTLCRDCIPIGHVIQSDDGQNAEKKKPYIVH